METVCMNKNFVLETINRILSSFFNYTNIQILFNYNIEWDFCQYLKKIFSFSHSPRRLSAFGEASRRERGFKRSNPNMDCHAFIKSRNDGKRLSLRGFAKKRSNPHKKKTLFTLDCFTPFSRSQ